MPNPTIREIAQAVEQYYSLQAGYLYRRTNMRKIARPRQIAMYLAKEMGGYSYPKIGAHFDRDYSTAIHARQRVLDRLQAGELASDVAAIAAIATAMCRARAEREAQEVNAIQAISRQAKLDRVQKANPQPYPKEPRTVMVPRRNKPASKPYARVAGGVFSSNGV